MDHGELNGVRVLPSAAYDEIWAHQATTTWAEMFGPQVTNYGLGWFVGEFEGEPLVGNYGTETGFQTHLGIFPDEHLAVVAMDNAYNPEEIAFPAYDIGNGIAGVLLGGEPSPAATDIHSVLTAANDTFMATYAQGDAAGMAALYTDDGQLLPPNADFVAGRPAIQQFWQSLMDEGITRVKLEIVEANAAGDTAYEVSRYTTYAGDQVADEGKYIVIWKQVDGAWKLYRDIFNSSMPD
jgi:uncharacterized protein (TIGR02246 family)